MTGNHALRGKGAEFVDHLEPAAKTAIQHGGVGKEHQIAREQGPGLLVEHGDIVVAMRGRPRPYRQGSRSEIEFDGAVDEESGRYHAHPIQ